MTGRYFSSSGAIDTCQVTGKDQMNFFDSEFAHYARSTLKRRRGLRLLGAFAVCWGAAILVAYGIFLLIRHSAGI